MLIGNHNSGKSSFLDALCFLKDILVHNVEERSAMLARAHLAK